MRLQRDLFSAGDRVSVAISGGADSVALLLSLVQANAAKAPLGVVLSALHVHHNLRGAEADADEAFVRSLCAALGVPLTVERVDVPARQAREREGVEEAARALRYNLFRRLLTSGRANMVATAHTLDDQAETVVMKLLRGAWTEGIGGIATVITLPGHRAPANHDQPPQPHQGRIVRPLLDVRRAEVEAFLRECRQDWREDATNRDLTLTRNRIRHELMPTLRSFNPGIDTALARLAEIARDEEAFWQSEVARLLPQILLPGRPVRGGGRAVGTVTGDRSCAVEIERLRPLAPALQRRLLRAAARSLGCRLSAAETAKLLGLGGLARSLPPIADRPGIRLELSHGLRAQRTARELQLSLSPAPFVARQPDGKTGGEEPGPE
ncbi:MAG TPA: tRNA lysidine(34) synthetase TilS [Acidobacteriaceae bacterium]|nr:tRNA lysidine(34) synthetase TilS [Acidobacteriaceae bacterium]